MKRISTLKGNSIKKGGAALSARSATQSEHHGEQVEGEEIQIIGTKERLEKEIMKLIKNDQVKQNIMRLDSNKDNSQ